MLDVQAVLETAARLEPLPNTVVRLAQLVADPNAEMGEIEEAVAFDPALSLRLLQAANAASNGRSAEIGTVREAVVRLGTGSLLAMATGTAVGTLLQSALRGYGLDEGTLWQHGVAAALAAERMPGAARVHLPPLCFTAALLHDVGKLVMDRFLDPEIVERRERLRQRDGLDLCAAESELLHLNHAELGGLICRRWQLPRALAAAVTYHHRPHLCPTEEGHEVGAHAVWLADVIARRIGAGPEETGPAEDRLEAVLGYLGISVEAFDRLRALTRERLADVGERFGMAVRETG